MVKNKGFSEALFTNIIKVYGLNNLHINDYFTKVSQNYVKDICPNKKSNTSLNFKRTMFRNKSETSQLREHWSIKG